MLWLRLRIFPCIACASVIVCAVASWGKPPKQNTQNPESGLVLHTTTRAVVLDVVVTDKRGNPVPSLTKSDFRVFEDDVPQEIVSFEAAGVHLHPISRAEETQTILILDEMNTRFEDLAFARFALRRLLTKNLGTLEEPTALLALTNSGLVQLHDYTTSGNELLQALEGHRSELPYRLRMGMEGAKERLMITISAIREIAASRADYRARKNLVWISPGFPILVNEELRTEDREVLFDAMRKLSVELLKTRMVVYTVDPRGVMPDDPGVENENVMGVRNPASYLRSLNPGARTTVADLALERLAIETGGEDLYGRNDLDQEIDNEIANGSTYVTMSYYPSNHNWDGSFRKIRVTVAKADLHAKTRDGYFGLPEPPPETEKVVARELAAAISSHLSFGTIPIRIDQTQLLPGTSDLKLVLSLDAERLSWTASDGKYHCRVEVVVANLSDTGERLDYQVQRIGGVMMARDFAVSKTKRWAFPLQLPLTPQASRIRVVVRDMGNGDIGTADILRQSLANSLHTLPPATGIN